MSMVSLSPFSFLEKRPSWKINIALTTPKDLLCRDCHVLRTEMGWGATLKLLSSNPLAYGLVGATVDLGSGLGRFYRFGPTVEVGVLANPWKFYKLRLRSLTYFDLFQTDRPPAFETLEFSQSISWLPHWEVRLLGQTTRGWGPANYLLPIYYEGKLSLNYYL